MYSHFFKAFHGLSLHTCVQLQKWMEDAGLDSWVDVIGNIHGRINGSNPDAPSVVVGSHYDTVHDGGK